MTSYSNVEASNVEAMIQWLHCRPSAIVIAKCLVYWILFLDTPPVSSAVPSQCTSTSAVAGVAVTAVLVLLVVAVVQSAVIWHLRRYKLQACNDSLAPVVYKTGDQNSVVQCNTHYIISECYCYIMHAWHKSVDQDLAEYCVKLVLTLYVILCIYGLI